MYIIIISLDLRNLRSRALFSEERKSIATRESADWKREKKKERLTQLLHESSAAPCLLRCRQSCRGPFRRPRTRQTIRCCIHNSMRMRQSIYRGNRESDARQEKEHDRDIRLAHIQTSAVSEHANETGHLPLWNQVKFIDRDPHRYTRRVK